MKSEVYTLSKDGFKRLSEHPELPKGTIIRAFGAFMEESTWATTGKGDEIVKLSPNDSESYFSNPFNNLDEYCRPISEKFGIGFYYDLDTPRAADEEIAQAIERANNFLKEEEEEKNRAEDERKRAREEVIKKYGAIFDQPSGEHTDAVLVAKHIRQDLANAFPGQRFSVRKADYSSINIEWQDGPTKEEVEQIAGKHKRMCVRDRWNDDLWDHNDTAFTSVFGGVDYLFYYRETAPENRGISLYTKPEPKQNKTKTETIEAKGLQIIDYSEKAIAVVGDTRAIKDTLKSLGGRFNSHLSCGAGWIFSKAKEDSLREALNI